MGEALTLQVGFRNVLVRIKQVVEVDGDIVVDGKVVRFHDSAELIETECLAESPGVAMHAALEAFQKRVVQSIRGD